MANPQKQNLLYLPLEAYQGRYTAELSKWEASTFSQHFNLSSLVPELSASDEQIHVGEVLDSVRRPLWALEQTKKLLSYAPAVGKVYFSDFFHPGLEALPYSRSRFSAFSYCWAQTFDQYDFTRRLFVNWMRPWEVMAFELYSKVFVACEELKDLIVSALPHTEEKVEVVGLPYSPSMVLGQLNCELPSNREFDVVYSSRWDVEKNPGFFLSLVREFPELKFLVCTGSADLKGTDMNAINEANRLRQDGRLTIYTNLKRPTYYNLLASSKVQFNCSRQDWVSFTLLDALTFGCMPLYPAIRSFPATLMYDEQFLYTPEDLESAKTKLSSLLERRPPQTDLLISAVLQQHQNALFRISQAIYEHSV